MGNIIKGILYTGLAAAVGVIGYIAGKSKHWKGISLTTMGLALILYTPRGCEMLEKYALIRGEVAKAKIYGYARKDSLDAILDIENRHDSSKTYVINALREVSSLDKTLKESYDELLTRAEDKYEQILSDSKLDYEQVLNDMKIQNGNLIKRLDVMTALQKQANAVAATVSTGNIHGSTLSSDTDSDYDNNTDPIIVTNTTRASREETGVGAYYGSSSDVRYRLIGPQEDSPVRSRAEYNKKLRDKEMKELVKMIEDAKKQDDRNNYR